MSKKLFLTMLFCFITISCFAGTVKYCDFKANCQDIVYNDKYSFKDFTHQSFKDAKDLKSGTVIYASVFYQEADEKATKKEDIQKHIFPETMIGVTFVNCDLNNVFIPSGNTVIDIAERTKLIKVQNDRSDWYLNDDLTPKEPLAKEQYLRLGISINPKDIPATKMTENIIEKKQKEIADALP